MTARFDSEGRLVAIDGVDGGTLAPDVVACLLGSLQRLLLSQPRRDDADADRPLLDRVTGAVPK